MSNTKTISRVSNRVIAFIKQEISDKKQRHAKMVQSVNPTVIQSLKSMKKIG